jgi:carbon-monoxide dehydrogenase large subunit
LEGPKRFVTGHGRFIDDFSLEGMLHLKVVRSPYARARVASVRGGIDGNEFKANMTAGGEGSWGGGPPTAPYPALASEYVSYAGQPVAVVFDEDPCKAEDSMEEVDAKYEPLKALVDPEESFEFEPIHPTMKNNIANAVKLGKDFDLKDAPVVLEDELANDRISPNPLETRGLVAHYDGARLTVWSSTQSVHSWKSGICSGLGLSGKDVRVIEVDTGGAFGCKSALYPEYLAACYVSIKTHRPVKWVESRSEHLQSASQGRGARGRMKLYATRDGRVVGLKGDLLIDSGAFAQGIAVAAPWIIGSQLTGPYTIENAFVTATSVYTNKVPYGPYRGAGRPEAAFFCERMMDLLADELRIDPVDLRMRNASPAPFTSPLGLKVDAFEPFLKSAKTELGYDGKNTKGIGFSSCVLVSAVQPGESCRLAVREGGVRVWLGGSQGGQHFAVMVKRVVSRELGVAPRAIELLAADTDQLDQGIGTWGSRTAIVASDAIVEAASKVKEEAESRFGAGYSQEDLLSGDFDVTVFHREGVPVNSFVANLTKASLDRETGVVDVLECRSYYDVGEPLNLDMVEGQVVGGTAQGVGQVLYETAKYSEEGQPLTSSLSEAGPIPASRMPKVVVKLAPQSPSLHRVRGVGEAATVAVPPALMRSVEGLLGGRLRRTPLNPEELREPDRKQKAR